MDVASLTPERVAEANRELAAKPAAEILQWAWDQFGARAAIGTSFQGAGLVATHLAYSHGCRFPIFTLDTGLLFPETQELKRRLEGFLQVQIALLQPELSVEEQARVHGDELWKRDPDLCCTVRKVLPLRDRLLELDCWITGLRRDQSAHRASAAAVELHAIGDTGNRQIVKLNPLVSWTREAVWEYIRAHAIPYNPLHDRGYRSIGCWPCTRPTSSGEDERAGRWMGFGKTECGIHTFTARKS